MPVGRFQVMAMLQAARAYELGLSLESAHSWGLNRAIFISAAKRGFKGGETRGGSQEKQKTSKEENTFYLGDDMAYKKEKDGLTLFTIGGKIQTEKDFEKQVISRFGKIFPRAWKESLEYVKEFPKETLLSANQFFNEVYRPKRDELTRKWSEAMEESSKSRRAIPKAA